MIGASDKLIEQLCKAATAIYIAVEAPVANDISKLFNDAAEALTASAPSVGAGEGEGNTQYNAGVITAIMKELIGSVERGRLAKTPWARSLVNDLIRRIANLRAMLAAAPSPALPKVGREETIRECAEIVRNYRRDASFDDSLVGTQEHTANQSNIADAVLALLNPPSPDINK